MWTEFWFQKQTKLNFNLTCQKEFCIFFWSSTSFSLAKIETSDAAPSSVLKHNPQIISYEFSQFLFTIFNLFPSHNFTSSIFFPFVIVYFFSFGNVFPEFRTVWIKMEIVDYQGSFYVHIYHVILINTRKRVFRSQFFDFFLRSKHCQIAQSDFNVLRFLSGFLAN